MNALDLEYFTKQDDFEEIKDYLNVEAVVEDFSPESFPPFVPDFSSSILIDNVPVVPMAKVAKLLSVLLKIYIQISPITESDICLPINEETGETYGFAFVKFVSVEEAEQALKVTQGLAIDKKHMFKISLYSDLDKYKTLPDTYVPPAKKTFNKRPDPTSWLTDSRCRDQFVLRHMHDTEIFWANNVAGEEPNMVYGGDREKQDGKVWCESYVCWSPQGTYLATFHIQGIKLWGSSNFESQGRFMHTKVEDLSFSPCENYLITYRYTYHPSLSPDALIVWDIRTGDKLRSFELKNPLDTKFHVQATITETKTTNEGKEDMKKIVRDRLVRGRVKDYKPDSMGGVFTIEEGNTIHEDIPFDKVIPVQEPNRLKWSPDGKYVARIGCDIVSVYALPNMQLLDKKSIAAKEVLDFVWSPKSNMISYWSPAVGNHPALINIMKLPEREDLCSRKLFDVVDGRMVWQNEGDYLCVYMTKTQGKKKTYVLMFFRTRDAGVPVEQIELNEPILSVNWEPSGDKIVIMYGETRSPNLAFYCMNSTPLEVKPVAGSKIAAVKPKMELTHLFTRSGANCSEVSWSPAGGMCTFAYFASDACVFELYDVDNNVSMAIRRHDRCNKLYWDPSGRYLVSCTITDLAREKEREAARSGRAAPHHPDDGYNIYTFQGVLLSSVKVEKMYQFAWRPRPKDLLSADEKKKVIKNLRKYEKQFESKDKQRKMEMMQQAQAERFKQAEEFYAIYSRCRDASVAMKHKRIELRGGYDSDDEAYYRTEVTVDETVISSKEQIMQ